MKIEQHIFLIGFMGAGKSTNAAMLSELTGAPHVEMDAEIVREQRMEIADIFARQGEEAFRDMETEIIRSLRGKRPSIVSCGGGAVLRDENVRAMKEMGKIVLLTASPKTVLNRVKDSGKRPVLNGRMNVSAIRELMEKRRAVYEEAADISVETDGRGAREICLEILGRIG